MSWIRSTKTVKGESINDPPTQDGGNGTTELISVPVDPPSKNLKKSKKELSDLFDSRQRVIHGIFVWGIRIFAVLIGVLVSLRFALLVFPTDWRWLEPNEIQALDNFIFSGAIGGLVGKNIEKAFKPKDDET